jgi:long-chain acyl-CoA synthetase
VGIELPFFGNTVASNAPAIVDPSGDVSYTYERWCDVVTVVGDALRDPLGEGRGLVMVFANVSAESLIAIHAGLASEHVVAVTNAEVCGPRREALLNAYQPDAVAEPETTDCSTDYARLGYRPITDPGVPGLGIWVRERAPVTTSVHPDLSLMLSTSGSTGSPKYVRLARKSVLHNAGAIRQGLDLKAGDVGLANLPFAYTYGLSILLSHLSAGAALGIANVGVLDSEFLDVCRRMGCTSIAGVPFSYVSIRRFRVAIDSLPALRQCTQSGSKMAEDDVRYFIDLLEKSGKTFRKMYGMTEATARITIMPVDASEEKLGSVGLPVADTRISIEPWRYEGVELGDESGQILVSGPGVMMGYASRRADLSRGDELKGVLRTGDLGRLDEDGYLFIEGRSGRFAKVFGTRIDLDQIQAVFAQGSAAVVEGGEDKVLVAVESNEEYEDPETVRQKILDEFGLPALSVRVTFVERLPRTTSGKVDYASLRHTTAW